MGNYSIKKTVEELYQINWRPSPPTAFPNRPPSPRLYAASKVETVNAPTKPGKYVHPNAVGRTVAPLKREEEGPTKYKKEQPIKDVGPPGYSSSTSTKNAKRSAKRKEQKSQTSEVQDVPSSEQEQSEKVGEGNSEESNSKDLSTDEIQKKVKAIQKKLRQIEILKQQSTEKALTKEQLDKLSSEKSLQAELKGLNEKQ